MLVEATVKLVLAGVLLPVQHVEMPAHATAGMQGGSKAATCGVV